VVSAATDIPAMKIHVDRIPEDGLTDHAVYDPAGLNLERDDIYLREPFEVEAAITKVYGELVVRAHIRCPLAMACARCLEEFTVTQESEAVFTYKVAPNDVVDITDDVRQEIMLGYPIVPICQPECKGLCIQCGQNLNDAICLHKSQEV